MPRGFTLLEILLAIFIFSVVVTTILGSYNLVFSNADSLHRGMADYEMAKTCLERMLADLTAVTVTPLPRYRPPKVLEEPDPHRIEGEVATEGGGSFSKIRFSSRAHISFEAVPRQGIAEIVYYVTQTEEERFELRRADRLHLYPPPEGGGGTGESRGDPVVCDRLKSFKLTYYDADGEAYETWDSDAEEVGYATPRAVGIELALVDASPLPVMKTMAVLPAFREGRE